MSVIHVNFSRERLAAAAFRFEVHACVEQFSQEQGCEVKPLNAGMLLLPEYIKRVFGVFVEPSSEGWMISREEEATTWEDYLHVKLAHELAERLGGMIFYGNSLQPVPVAPDSFATFDHYAETVLGDAEGLLRETKMTWIYSHQNRTLR